MTDNRETVFEQAHTPTDDEADDICDCECECHKEGIE